MVPFISYTAYLIVGIIIELQLVKEELLHFNGSFASSISNDRHGLHNCTADLIEPEVREVIRPGHRRVLKAEELLKSFLKMIETYEIEVGRRTVDQSFSSFDSHAIEVSTVHQCTNKDG